MLQPFLKVFLDIVLGRKGPQDLPTSTALLLLTLVAYVATSALQLAVMHEPASMWLFFLVADPLLLLGWTWFVLRVYRHGERFTQTATALLGTGAFLSMVLYFPVQFLLVGLDEGASSLAAVASIVLLAVFATVNGRIYRSALETGLFTGAAIALTYFFAMNTMAGALRHGSP